MWASLATVLSPYSKKSSNPRCIVHISSGFLCRQKHMLGWSSCQGTDLEVEHGPRVMHSGQYFFLQGGEGKS